MACVRYSTENFRYHPASQTLHVNSGELVRKSHDPEKTLFGPVTLAPNSKGERFVSEGFGLVSHKTGYEVDFQLVDVLNADYEVIYVLEPVLDPELPIFNQVADKVRQVVVHQF
jgi:hypothetical protein